MFATLDRQVLALDWLVIGTLLSFGLWPMFTVRKRRHEYEYLRYLLGTYYTVSLHSQDAPPPTRAEVSHGDG